MTGSPWSASSRPRSTPLRSRPSSACTRCRPTAASWTRTSCARRPRACPRSRSSRCCGSTPAARPRRAARREGEFGDAVDERRDLAAAMAFVAERGAAAAVAAGLVVRNRDRPQVRAAASDRGRHPALAAAAPHDAGRGRRLGGRRRAAGRDRPGARRLPAARRGRDPVRLGAATPSWSPSRAASTSGWGRSRPSGCSPRSSRGSIPRRCRCRRSGTPDRRERCRMKSCRP